MNNVLVIGEVLIDRFPDYRRIGGAPLNFATHLHRLSAPVRMVSRVGSDADGRSILSHMAACGLSVSDIQIDDTHQTGCVDVSLDGDGSPTFDIVAPAAYDFIRLQDVIGRGALADTELIYFGSLAQRSTAGFEQVAALLAARPAGTRCFCDINLRAPHFDDNVIVHCLKRADILKLNDDELGIIGRLMGFGGSLADIAGRLMAEYAIDTLALTQGAEGSTVFKGAQRYPSPPPPQTAVRDTVGAGDAFAAVLAAGVLLDRPLSSVVAAATAFAAYICTQPGAVPDADTAYETALRQMGVNR